MLKVTSIRLSEYLLRLHSRLMRRRAIPIFLPRKSLNLLLNLRVYKMILVHAILLLELLLLQQLHLKNARLVHEPIRRSIFNI